MKKSAFTLAEIMIVLTVIAILTAILLPSARNVMPNDNVMKFKKGHNTLLSAVKGLVESDKYYYNGDLGIKADGSLVDNPNYFCNSLADVLSVKSVNCSDDGDGDTLDSIAVANLPDFATDELDGEKMYDLADYICANYIDSGEEIVLSNNTVIYTVKPFYHFGSKFTDASGNEGRVFNLCSKEQRYKWLCVDIDGIGKGEAPFGYALRADGRMFSGSRALAWIDRNIQSNNEETLTISSISSYSPSTPTMIAENDSCGAITPPAPEPTCELSEHCIACDNTTGNCTECDDGYTVKNGICKSSEFLYTYNGSSSKTTEANYTLIKLTSGGTFTANSDASGEIFLVGGGGGGKGSTTQSCNNGACGCPGGNLRTEFDFTEGTSWTVTIGGGGAAGRNSWSDSCNAGGPLNGNSGGATSFGDLLVSGGAGGGGSCTAQTNVEFAGTIYSYTCAGGTAPGTGGNKGSGCGYVPNGSCGQAYIGYKGTDGYSGIVVIKIPK